MKKIVIILIMLSFSFLVVSGQAESFHEDTENFLLEETEAELKKQAKASNSL